MAYDRGAQSSLVAALLAEAPAGPALDYLVVTYRPLPGAIAFSPSGPVARTISSGRNLYGEKLLASVEASAARIEELLRAAPPAVVRSLCSNRNLSDGQVASLVSRAIDRRDGALAMNIVRFRPDFALHGGNAAKMLSLLSLRTGAKGYDVLAGSVAMMSPSEFDALLRLEGDTPAELVSESVTRAARSLLEGSAVAPSLESLVRILDAAGIGAGQSRSYGWSYTVASSPLLSFRGFRGEVQRAPAKLRRAALRILAAKSRSSSFAAPRQHSCQFRVVAALSALLGLPTPGPDGWESWARPFEVFAALPAEEKTRIVGRGGDLAAELLFHFPAARASTAACCDSLAAGVLAELANYPDSAGALSSRLGELAASGRADLGSLAEQMRLLYPHADFVPLLHLMLLDPSSHAAAWALAASLDDPDIGRAVSCLPPAARESLEGVLCQQAALDPYCDDSGLSRALRVPLGVTPFSAWPLRPRRAAARLALSKASTPREVEALVRLERDWEGSFEDLLGCAAALSS